MPESSNRGSNRRKIKKAFRQGVSTVFRLAMGQSQSSHDLTRRGSRRAPANGFIPDESVPALKFHQIHGENIRLEQGGFVAKRVASYCNGLLFSDRPVLVGERVCLGLTELSSRWSGVIRIGFTVHNPIAHQGCLPKYACPDLTSKPGYWAKALSQRYTEANVRVHFNVAANGDVHFGADGTDLGVFFSGVDTRRPLWAMVDLYGNCTGIELMDLRRNLNNCTLRRQPNAPLPPLPSQPVPSHNTLPYPSSHSEPNIQTLNARLTDMSLNPPQYVPPPDVVPVAVNPMPNFLPIKHNSGLVFRPMSFHFCTGRHVKLNGNTLATRLDEEFAQGYVFTSSAIKLGERIVIQVLATEDSYIGSLAFGLTNCDPSTIDTRELPEDSDLLLDRPEYWVVSKDVASSPAVADELSFCVRLDGAVEFSKNGGPPSVFMHVDPAQRLWAFWDIYGHTARIRMLGATNLPLQAPNSANTEAPLVGIDVPNPTNSDDISGTPGSTTECIVCLERGVNSVIYACGHMCMCYECAIKQWKGRGGGFCPICRENIRDVIKTFRS